jgi:hypothetical protein
VRRRQESRDRARVATGLSRFLAATREKPGFLRLAWQSLAWLSIMTLVTSCVVADPPQYSDPVRTRPELSSYSAKPPISLVVIIPTPSPATPTFKVPIRSEDAGETLLANFWLDYGSAKQKFINSQFIPPSTYNDTTDRFITFLWTNVSADDAGCHTFSMVVAHVSSFPTNPQDLDPVKGDQDGALISWWVNVNPAADSLYNLVNCPSPNSQVTAP